MIQVLGRVEGLEEGSETWEERVRGLVRRINQFQQRVLAVQVSIGPLQNGPLLASTRQQSFLSETANRNPASAEQGGPAGRGLAPSGGGRVSSSF